MAAIKPFRALRPQNKFASHVAAKPYDVLNSEEARAEAAGNPFSFLHVTKAEIDLPAGTDNHAPIVYETARKNLEHFRKDGILFEEEIPCYYIYRLVMNGRSQTGLVCVSSVEDYHNDIIKKHEFTRPEKEQDRIDHMLAIQAQTGNVFLAYRDVDEINQLLSGWIERHEPIYDFSAVDGVHHTVWKIDEPQAVKSISALFLRKVPFTYIADGHHRAASAAKVNARLPELESSAFFLTTIFPASELAIMDYNRVVKDLNNLQPDEFLKKIEADFEVERANGPVAPAKLHQFGLYTNHQWYRLQSRAGSFTTDPIGVLDVTILSNNILDKILGIRDQRTDKRIDFVGGIRGLGELEKRVDNGEMKLAFSLHPVSIPQLFDIADSGNVMPPKSTWFEPKLRDGLLTHIL